MVEMHSAFFGGSVMRETRITVGQHCLLKFPGHCQVLLEGLILRAQFPCERGEFFFSLLLPRNVTREPKGADDLSVGISQRKLCSRNPRFTSVGPSLLLLHVHQRSPGAQNLLFITQRGLGMYG